MEKNAPSEVMLVPDRDNWAQSAHHRYAIDLYHSRYYWEAHEVWEELWHELPRLSPERFTLRALIQLSASALKCSMSNQRAALTLLKNATRNLEAASSHWLVRGTPVAAIDLIALTLAIGEWESRGLEGQAPSLPFEER
jgi:predicted metal-dependent hydrolase